ncbi:SDR family NAD(P)-dependent oxidoreductase [Terracidiphilus sp.]|uniref:SDR family NAD(P)-dependent oxidoreductase n=1 Tax=Terracidiphilus sp. TaxID=1964191 RepID=UPI003C23972A
MKSLAQRVFTLDDQIRFASISGDSNPMHMDALQARRTQAGAPVVHGIHLLLWALDALAHAHLDLPQLRSLRAHFNKFVYLDEPVEIVLSEYSPKGARLHVAVDGIPRSKFNIAFGDVAAECPSISNALTPLITIPNAASDLKFEEMASLSGRLPFRMQPEDAQAFFPSATEWLGAQRIASLAASTCLAGMVCPGLHSIYSELSVKACGESSAQNFLDFHVSQADERFRSIELEIAGGGFTGTAYCTARLPPVEQATMQSLAGLVSPGEFVGSTALIIGGSRGLGELTAKLIAAGGGHVVVTWKNGKDDAERVAHQIRSAGGACDTLPYDAGKPASEQLTSLAHIPSHVYYFATPSIFRPQSEMFIANRLREFEEIYVHGFWQLIRALRAMQPGLSLFYPSSIAVEERPHGMTEYTMAKAAGEVLCADVNESMAPLHVTTSRLPRLLTDQTASVAATETENLVDVMLPIIREVQSWPR